ncbi:sodium:solute symporter [Gemmatimonas phototrophica]|uniref:Sodium:solute symporter n=2 Tax=Gemmatimonas phototrophica TaxID=1379270 RepID=A0A143BFU9_9BACT|nr:sodium:solute symporter [Gemmatimonas phototrophica]
MTLALLAAFGLSLRARGAQSLEQWSAASRGFGSVFIFMLLAGEIYTTFTFLGGSGWAYARGAPAYYIIGYAAVAYTASYWLLPAIWRRGAAWQVITQPEYFARAFNSPWFGRVVAVVGVCALIPYLVLQLKGLGILVTEASYGRIGPNVAIPIGTGATVVYVIIAGVRGSALTAALKDTLVLVSVVGLGIALPYTLYGGIGPMFDILITQRPDLFLFPATGLSGTWYTSTVLMTVFGFYMWPHTFGSVFTARSEASFRRNAILMPLYQIVLLFVFFIGFAAITAVPGLEGADVDLALLRVTRQTYGPWIMGLVGAAGVLTALVPGSLILMSAATILARLFTGTAAASAEREVRLARLMVPLVATVALYFVFRGGQTIVTLLLFAYAIVTQLFPAVIVSLRWPRRSHAGAACAGIAVGVGLVVYTTLAGITMSTAFPSMPSAFTDINIGVLALIANVATLGVITLTRAPSDG